MILMLVDHQALSMLLALFIDRASQDSTSPKPRLRKFGQPFTNFSRLHLLLMGQPRKRISRQLRELCLTLCELQLLRLSLILLHYLTGVIINRLRLSRLLGDKSEILLGLGQPNQVLCGLHVTNDAFKLLLLVTFIELIHASAGDDCVVVGRPTCGVDDTLGDAWVAG